MKAGEVQSHAVYPLASNVALKPPDGIQAKVSQMTEDCQLKLQDTLQKIINDSNGGMICIII